MVFSSIAPYYPILWKQLLSLILFLKFENGLNGKYIYTLNFSVDKIIAMLVSRKLDSGMEIQSV